MKALRKRVLVTGGAGFLGSHLCERLLDAGFDVLCVDNYFTGARDNIVHLLGNPHFEAIRHDVGLEAAVSCADRDREAALQHRDDAHGDDGPQRHADPD